MEDSGSEILGYFSNRIKEAKEKQLKELDLSVPYDTHENDKLTCIPQEVFELTQLESLNLSDNGLKSIPKSITQFTNLTQLNLSNSNNGLKSIPESITQFTNLTHLDLRDNRLKSIPKYYLAHQSHPPEFK